MRKFRNIVFLLLCLCSSVILDEKSLHIVKYTENYCHLNMNIEMVNWPISAAYYRFLILEGKAIKSETKPLNNTLDYGESSLVQVSFLRNLTKTEDKRTGVVELMFPNATTCARHLLAQFQLTNHMGEDTSSECLNILGCTKKIDWKHKCNAVELLPEAKIVEVLTSSRSADETEQVVFTVGHRALYTCRTDYDKSYTMAWRQTQGDKTLSEIKSDIGRTFTLDLTFTQFDNGTSIYCVLLENFVGTHFRSRKILFVWHGKVAKNSMIYDERMGEPRHKSGGIINMRCSGYTSMNWYRVKDNTIDYKFSKAFLYNNRTLVLPLTREESLNGAGLVCIGYELSLAPAGYRRRVSTIFNLPIDGPQVATEGITEYGVMDVSSASSAEDELRNDDAAGNQVLYIAVGSALAAACAAAAACWFRTKTRSPLEVETYACADTVQYASLQVAAASNRLVHRDDTPYARIVGVLQNK